jgi:hypothetical protein
MGALLLAASLPSCDLGSGPAPVPASLVAVTAVDQAGTVASAVPQAPAVRVLSKKGKPMARREVSFSVVGGGGHVTGEVQVTDDDGVAGVGSWVLGSVAGVNTLHANVPGLTPVEFTATARAASPATLSVLDGHERDGVVGSELVPTPAVRVRDAYANPVSGTAVHFEVTLGGGTLEGGSATTDQEGIARVVSWTLGRTPGPNILSASVTGLAPVSFLASAAADAPALVTVFQGDHQAATVGTPVPLAPSVRVADRFGNLLNGIPVVFEVASGNGVLVGETAVTNPSGIAALGSWTLGTTAGVQTLLAKVSGVDPVTISAVADAGPPADAQVHAGGDQTGTVGTPVEVPPAVMVRDAFGNPVPGIAVVFSESGSPVPGGEAGSFPARDPASAKAAHAGSGAAPDGEGVTGREALTDTSGVAAVESWVLGTVAGSYQLTALVSGLGVPLVFSALALPGVAAGLDKVQGDGQSVPTDTPVPVLPAVRVADRFGNGVEGIEVVFSVTGGGGSVTGDTTTSGVGGLASVGSWTLGASPGPNTLSAAAASLGSVTFMANGLAAVPAAVTKVSGDEQTAPVGTALPIPLRVRVTDSGGQGIPLVSVTFSVTVGNGVITGEAAVTDSGGVAELGSWTLGPVAGANNLRAVVGGGDLAPVFFSATGTPGPPASMTLNGGDGQSALVGAPVPIPPTVRITDAFYNPVPGVAVSFSVAPGQGSVTGSPARTDSNGVAGVTSWTLGPDPGVNIVTAATAGLDEVVFSATATGAVPVGEFSVELQFMTSVDPEQEAIFREAAARWQEVIVGDIPDFTGVLPAGGCQPVEETEGVDDVKIYISVVPIDGAGGVLGQAGPCYIWNPDGRILPITGIVRLDEADVAEMLTKGLLEDVIIHEIGHVLGIGTLWNASPNAFLVGGGGSDPYFDGAGAVAAFDAAGGSDRSTPKVPVENTGGAGTRDAHWRETVLNAELMTGWIEPPGTPNPLSMITIASLADMGYVVNMAAADPYLVFSPLAAPAQDTGTRVFLKELPPPTPIFVGLPGVSRSP